MTPDIRRRAAWGFLADAKSCRFDANRSAVPNCASSCQSPGNAAIRALPTDSTMTRTLDRHPVRRPAPVLRGSGGSQIFLGVVALLATLLGAGAARADEASLKLPDLSLVTCAGVGTDGRSLLLGGMAVC